MRIVLTALTWAVVSGLTAAWADRAAGRPELVWYRSPVDGSRQAYGAYVPAAPPLQGGYPAVFHTHGYGWSVSSNFSAWQREWAEAHRWVLINLNARGPQFYEGIGEVATLEVVRDAIARFGLDRRRLYITGSSMGGTGAFRHGLRHPEVFAAAAGVDGWSDFRLWHYEWYARADARDSIEEFRRPLLQACSPIYWAGRGQWGAIKTIVDGRDTTVWPDHGLSLHATLSGLADRKEGYDAALVLHYDRGHGGGYSLPDIYQFFLGRQGPEQPERFHLRTYVLKHGEMYWGKVNEFGFFGLPATLASERSEGTITVLTDNVERFTLHLQAAVQPDTAVVRVYADGLECFEGPPDTVQFEALRDWRGSIAAWVPVSDHRGLAPRKSAELAGPIGEVFNRPFVVAYGTAGSAHMTAQHRREAEDFTSGWRGFMIRQGAEPDAIGPYPEERLPPHALQQRGLVIFGSRETSRLLQQAYRAADMPVIIGDDYVTVADDSGPDRTYHGEQFGAFVCFPNPLADNRQYLLIARGQWFTKPDGTLPAGLEYDMEKLPWAYPDYVVFNADQRQLPHVLNVNNKPPVTCYEAAYFVEAGYFDRHWRPHRGVTLERVRAQRPEGVRLIHVEQIRRTEQGAGVLVVDTAGQPCADARVTVTWPDQAYSVSALSDQDGWACVTGPPDAPRGAEARLTSVMATGAVHHFTADLARSTSDGPLRLLLSSAQVKMDRSGGPQYELSATVVNRGTEPLRALLRPVTAVGTWEPGQARLSLQPGQQSKLPLTWWPREEAGRRPLPVGEYTLSVACDVDGASAAPQSARATAAVRVRVGLQNLGLVRVAESTVPDIVAGRRWLLQCRLVNSGHEPVQVALGCSIIPAETILTGSRWRYLPPRVVTVPEHGDAVVSWEQGIDETALPIGLYEAVIYGVDTLELNTRTRFSVTDEPGR